MDGQSALPTMQPIDSPPLSSLCSVCGQVYLGRMMNGRLSSLSTHTQYPAV